MGQRNLGMFLYVVVLLMSASFIPPGMADIKPVPLCSPGDRFNLAVRHIPLSDSPQGPHRHCSIRKGLPVLFF